IDDTKLLGFPQHTFTLNTGYRFGKNFSLNLTSRLMGRRYGYDVVLNSSGQLTAARLESRSGEMLLNLYARYENLFTPGLTMGLGVYDLLNSQDEFIQPFFGISSPLPGPSREIVFKVNYDLPWGRKKGDK
ncbi:MAG: hypothetical protein AAF570_09440, partial [Bacteroidota bacterium]